MRWTFILPLILVLNASAQSVIPETEKLHSLCKVWGYLKYYHPQVAKGKIDWDQELIIKIPQFEKVTDKESMSKFYMDWINELGEIDGCDACSEKKHEETGFNFDLSWIEDDRLYSKELQELLRKIEKNRYNKKHHYYTFWGTGNVDLRHWRTKETLIFPSYEYRLYDVFNFWNVIEYFFPYKYVMDEDWDQVLKNVIPDVRHTKDSIQYHLAYLNLLQAVGDGHVSNSSPVLWRLQGRGFYGFRLKIFDTTAIVSGFRNPALEDDYNLKVGDRILKVNGKKMSDIIEKKKATPLHQIRQDIRDIWKSWSQNLNLWMIHGSGIMPFMRLNAMEKSSSIP